MTRILTPDICVIGAGSGGLSVAAAAAAFGAEVVLVEKGRMGGDCLNYGCVPSKALIAAGKVAQAMREAAPFGVAAVEPVIDFAEVHRHVHSVIAGIAPNDSVERFTSLGVQVVQAEGRFRDGRTLLAGDAEIRARRFVIATGSRPRLPPIPGLDEVDALTNETIFDLTKRPGHLVVIGGGPIGLELALAHRRLGCAVTVVESGTALAREDPELAAPALRRMRDEGVVIHEGATVTGVERPDPTDIRLGCEKDGAAFVVEGTHLLVATGRTPNVEGLGLEAAGVAHGPKGIRTDDGLRTSNRRIYAVGDVAGRQQFTHVANYHASLILRPLLFRLPAREKPGIVPRATFLSPEVAQVGQTEAEARAAGIPVSVLRVPLADNDRARTERLTDGLIKVIAGRRGRIVGVGIAAENASEMINMWALAISKGLSLRDVAGYVAPYPTMSEFGKRAAIFYFAGAARHRGVRWLVRLLSRFG